MKSVAHADSRALGFIGLGLMGIPMCHQLLQARWKLNIWNRNADKYQQLPEGLSTSSPHELADRSDVILLCLANDQAMQAICYGDEGIFTTDLSGKICIDFSSTSPQLTRELAQRCALSGGQWIDAPVSGGVAGAESGNLVIMCGGDEQAIESAREIFLTVGKRYTRLGSHGAGQIGKICNQLIVASNAMLIAEMVSLAQNAGIAADKLPAALAGGFADSLPFQILTPRMASGSFEPVQWKVETLLKDLNNTLQLAKDCHSNTPMAELAANLMARHCQNGYATDDLSTLIKLHTDKQQAS